jgi:GNAT superfamily N-acetyltransferase
LATRRIGHGELDAWAETSAQGWGESPELAAFMHEFGTITGRSRGVSCFVAELAGRMVATGALAMHGGVALLAGASTIPAFRGRGAQTALLEARLAYAAGHGCDLAMMGAAPGSTSQTNAERQGFRIAYTRLKWQRPHRAL